MGATVYLKVYDYLPYKDALNPGGFFPVHPPNYKILFMLYFKYSMNSSCPLSQHYPNYLSRPLQEPYSWLRRKATLLHSLCHCCCYRKHTEDVTLSLSSLLLLSDSSSPRAIFLKNKNLLGIF